MATVTVETPACMVCSKATSMVVDADSLRAWQMGELIQNAFPTMSVDDREQLKTGTHPACWDAMFGLPEAEDED